jgi:hypothetical protein
MVILAVYVICNSAADSHPLRSWDDREEPAGRCHESKYFSEKNAALAPDDTVVPIKIDKAIQPATIQENSPIVKTDIAIATPVPESQCELRSGDARQLFVSPGQPQDFLARWRETSPGFVTAQRHLNSPPITGG